MSGVRNHAGPTVPFVRFPALTTSFASRSAPCLISPTHTLPFPVSFHSPSHLLDPFNCSSRSPPSPIVESHPRYVVVRATYRYALPSVSIPYSIHHLPPLLGHSRIAFPVLVPSPHRPSSSRPAATISWSQLQYTVPNIPIFPFPYSLLAPPLPLPLPPWSSYLGLVLLALTPALSGPVTPSHPPFTLTLFTLTVPVLSRPPSLALSSPARPLTLPVPAWISPRCRVFAFVGHTFFGVYVALRSRVTNHYKNV